MLTYLGNRFSFCVLCLNTDCSSAAEQLNHEGRCVYREIVDSVRMMVITLILNHKLPVHNLFVSSNCFKCNLNMFTKIY